MGAKLSHSCLIGRVEELEPQLSVSRSQLNFLFSHHRPLTYFHLEILISPTSSEVPRLISKSIVVWLNSSLYLHTPTMPPRAHIDDDVASLISSNDSINAMDFVQRANQMMADVLIP